MALAIFAAETSNPKVRAASIAVISLLANVALQVVKRQLGL